MQFFSLLDIILTPIYLGVIYFVSKLIQSRNIEARPEYKYYLKAITLKILGGIGLVAVYTLYYPNGDTTNYFHDGVVINRLLFKNASSGLHVLFNGANRENFYLFDSDTGYPTYFRDNATAFVSQIVAVLAFLGCRSLIPTTLLMAWISFIGIWHLYRIFLDEFPTLSKEMAIAFFYIPSVLFWGSGLMKDTISLSALGYFTFAFYQLFIRRKRILINLIMIFICVKILLIVKAYIFFGVLPGAMIWMVSSYLSKVKLRFIRFIIGPIFFLITVLGAYAVLYSMGDSLGKFSVDQILDRAVITQRDLKSDHYQGNSFDIGDFDSTLPSILSVSHKALFAGLFRPFILEARNLLMFISSIENLLLLIFTLSLLIKLRIVGFFKYLYVNSLLTFSLIFSIFFSLSVGLSTSNFGSMVRYKIPGLPFYLASLFIIRHLNKEEKEKRAATEIEPQKFKQIEL
jgi:hypothetical protein